MGVKIKAGMALGGLLLSWMFGLNFLSGIATTVDSTGNVLVDIADGIGMVSKGIEALEGYLDPQPKDPEKAQDPADANAAPPVAAEPASSSAAPAEPEAGLAPDPTPMICKKGKCRPYDPTQDKYLQEQLIRAERERILQAARQQAAGDLSPLPPLRIRLGDDDEWEEMMEDQEEWLDENGHKLVERVVGRARNHRAERLPPRGSRGTATNINGGGQKKKKKSESLKSVGGEVLSNQGAQQSDRTEEKVTLNDGESVADNVSQPLQEEGRMRRGFRRVLTSVSGLCKRVSTLILKVVKTIFPWNRRAKRRLASGGGVEDEEEL